MSDSSRSHWRSLAQELGTPLPPEKAQAPSSPAAEPAAESPKAAPPPRRTAQHKPPRAPAPAGGRKHWAALAGELGLEVPPVEEVDSPVAPKEAEPPPAEPIWPVRDTAEEAFAEAHSPAEEEAVVMTLPPEELVEESGQAATEILSEVSDIYVFDRAPARQPPNLSQDEDWEGPSSDEPEAGTQPQEQPISLAGEREQSEARGERRGRRRRRRGRGRGDQSRSPSSADEPADDRQRRGADDQGRFAPATDDLEDDDQLSEDEPQEAAGQLRERKFPTWQEAMELIISKNMASRRDGGRRGGRGR